jgi:hypothetical protein
MPDTYSYARIKSVKHTVNSGEDGSGVAYVSIHQNVHTTDDWIYTLSIKDSANQEKVDGVKHYYDSNSGVVCVLDGSTTVDENDVVTLSGHFV